jgi:hypothetical protein
LSCLLYLKKSAAVKMPPMKKQMAASQLLTAS